MHFLSHIPNWSEEHETLKREQTNQLLRTWFDQGILEKGLTLANDQSINTFLMYREGVGAVFQDGATVQVRTVPAQGAGLQFVCRDTWCSVCKMDKRRTFRCQHVAAIMLLLLNCRKRDEKLPLTLSFPQSRWEHVGRSLAGLTENVRVELTLTAEEGGYLLQAEASNGFDCQVRLSEKAAAMSVSLYPSLPCPTTLKPAVSSFKKIAVALQEQLISQNRTETERQLAEMGQATRGELVEKSIWMQLGRLLAMSEIGLEMRYERLPDKRFQLSFRSSQGRTVFSLTLPKHRTVELLEKIESKSFSENRLPPARACSSVSFDDYGGNIVVESCIRLQDGRLFPMESLAEDLYGGHYYLEGEGFVKAINLLSDQQIVRPVEEQPTLFSFMRKQSSPEFRYLVKRDEIPDFLKKNKERLVNGCHEVHPDVLAVEIVEIPQCLDLTEFQETDQWCYLVGSYNLGKQSVNLVELLEKAAGKAEYLPGRQWLSLKNSALSWFHFLGEDRICTFPGSTEKGIRLRPHELLALNAQVPKIAPAGRKKRMGRDLSSFLDSAHEPPDPEFVEVMSHLREYQKNGTMWLAYLIRHHLGGLLADDMGLGKTHQALSCIEYLLGKNGTLRFLVVCPTGVLFNWIEKGRRFFPAVEMEIYHGSSRDRERIGSVQVTVTSFGTMRNDIDWFSKVGFEAVFFDEMQQLKNSNTLVHEAAAMLDSRSIIGLTGTPIENSVLELRALFDLCLPGFFQNEEFYYRYVRRDSKETRKELSGITRPFILRRTRKQVLEDLPPVIDDVRMCQLHEDQEILYREILETNESLCSGLVSGKQVDFMSVLAILTRLKQICNHPCLLESCDSPERYGSGKWEQWEEIIDECLDNQVKVVVFSQYTTMLDLMQQSLEAGKVGYVTIRGNMTAKKRQAAINRFNEDPSCPVCLASLLAGGVGIDLTAAQVVVHYDRWWNPAKEEQATARVHRMGQREVVQVIKLVTENTLEEKIHVLLQNKQKLAADVIVEDDASILKSISREELASLFQ